MATPFEKLQRELEGSQVHNYQDKPLSEFTKKDTLFVKKLDNAGRSITYYGTVEKFERGIVTIKLINGTPSWHVTRQMVGELITSRPDKCSVYGVSASDQNRAYCHWFRKNDHGVWRPQ